MEETQPELNSSASGFEEAGQPAPGPAAGAGKWWGILLVVMLVVISGSYVISQYNGLQDRDKDVDAQWAYVLNQYTRRADLIPNVVTVVKTYAAQESALFTEIAQARQRIATLSAAAGNSRDPGVLQQFQAAQKDLSAPLSRLLLVAERYPELKSSGLYQDLLIQLEGTENRISYARQRYI
jgi:LemA protein